MDMFDFCDTNVGLDFQLIPKYGGWLRNPFLTTLILWEAIWFLQGNRIIQRFLRWCEMDLVHPQYHRTPSEGRKSGGLSFGFLRTLQGTPPHGPPPRKPTFPQPWVTPFEKKGTSLRMMGPTFCLSPLERIEAYFL